MLWISFSLYLPHLALPFVLGFIFQVPILLLLRIFVIVSLSNTIQHCIEFHNFCPFCIYLTCFSLPSSLRSHFARQASAWSISSCYNISLCTCLSHSFLKSYFVTVYFVYIIAVTIILWQQHPSARLRQPRTNSKISQDKCIFSFSCSAMAAGSVWPFCHSSFLSPFK